MNQEMWHCPDKAAGETSVLLEWREARGGGRKKDSLGRYGKQSQSEVRDFCGSPLCAP